MFRVHVSVQSTHISLQRSLVYRQDYQSHVAHHSVRIIEWMRKRGSQKGKKKLLSLIAQRSDATKWAALLVFTLKRGHSGVKVKRLNGLKLRRGSQLSATEAQESASFHSSQTLQVITPWLARRTISAVKSAALMCSWNENLNTLGLQ